MMKNSIVNLAIFLTAALLLLAHAATFPLFISDDTYISLRYVKRFLDGYGLTWTDGIPVEGYSNLLWVLLLSLGGALGFEIVLFSRVLGIFCTLLAFAALLYAYPYQGGRLSALPALTALLFLALSSSVAIWAVAGLEQPLVLALLAWALVLGFKLLEAERPSGGLIALVGLLLGLLCLSRPDGALFTVAFVAALLPARGFSRDTVLRDTVLRDTVLLAVKLGIIPVLCYLGQLLFRLNYYGAWVPNTALVKFTLSDEHVALGWRYIGLGLPRLLVLVLLAGLWFFISWRQGERRGRSWLLLACLVLWTAYVISIGGDINRGWRHLIPHFLLLAIATAELLRFVVQRLSPAPRREFLIVLPFLVLLHLAIQVFDVENQDARRDPHVILGQQVGLFLRDIWGPQAPLLAVENAGIVPFYSELPSLDLLGLNDREIARSRSAEHGRGFIGHDAAHGQYVIERGPDLVIFCYPLGHDEACWPGGQELFEQPGFASAYQLVHLLVDPTEDMILKSWLRREGGVLGINRQPEQVIVPAYFLEADDPDKADNPDKAVRVYRSAPNELAVDLPAQGRLRVSLPLAAGAWRLETSPLSPALKAALELEPAGTIVAEGSLPLDFDLGASAELAIVLSNSAAESAAITAVMFKRQEGYQED